MDIEKYISERLDPEIRWYSQKASKNQKLYKRFQIIETILATLIPLLSSHTDLSFMPFIIGVFGATIAIIESISKLYKFHENWIQYRSTAEMLKHEKYLFLTKSRPYLNSEESIVNTFIQNIEEIISSESKSWSQMNMENLPSNSNN